MQRRTFVTGVAASIALPLARAQNLPQGPVRIIVGFAPGGGTDLLARVIGQKLGEMWKTQVIVENKAGASGTIAADYVSKQPSTAPCCTWRTSTATRSSRTCRS
jgi:tripartite-type tricarboxylate transporter receptor subunit TctC